MGFKVDEHADLFPQGTFLLEVDDCVQKFSKKGDGMFAVKLRDVYSGRTLFENWMMEGRGQGMSVPKLRALGLDLTGMIEAQDCVGRRMIASVKHKSSEEFGDQAQISKAWPESSPPPDWKKPDEPPETPPQTLANAEDVPF